VLQAKIVCLTNKIKQRIATANYNFF